MAKKEVDVLVFLCDKRLIDVKVFQGSEHDRLYKSIKAIIKVLKKWKIEHNLDSDEVNTADDLYVVRTMNHYKSLLKETPYEIIWGSPFLE